MVPVLTSLPLLSGGGEMDLLQAAMMQEATPPKARKEVETMPGPVQDVTRQLKAKAQDAHSVALEELARYQEIGDRPEGLAAARRVQGSSVTSLYFAHIYGDSKKGADYALSYLQSHGLEDCYAAQEM